MSGTAPLRLACSWIAWDATEDETALKLLLRLGVEGVEVAPTRLWPGWVGANPKAAVERRTWLADQGLSVPAMQAVFFGVQGAHLFEPAGQPLFESHLGRVAELAQGLGAAVVVLGAPASRRRGDRSLEAAFDEAEPVLARTAARMAQAGVRLALEAVPASYGCDFLLSCAEVQAMVARVNHPGLTWHLDLAALWAAGETLDAVWPTDGAEPAHVHLSEPGLGDFVSPVIATHVDNLRQLRQRSYAGWVSVEMKACPAGLVAGGPWNLWRESDVGR